MVPGPGGGLPGLRGGLLPGGVPGLGGSAPGGVCLVRGGLPQCMLGYTPHPPCGQTHACENITLAQLRCGRK